MEFYFIITIAAPGSNRVRSATVSGTTHARPGQTRKDLFKVALSYARSQTGISDPIVTFFDLAPNELPALASPGPR